MIRLSLKFSFNRKTSRRQLSNQERQSLDTFCVFGSIPYLTLYLTHNIVCANYTHQNKNLKQFGQRFALLQIFKWNICSQTIDLSKLTEVFKRRIKFRIRIGKVNAKSLNKNDVFAMELSGKFTQFE